MARRLQQGMTLIEVMVALLVLSLGVMAAAALQGRALHGTDGALRTTQALYLAQALLEGARAAGGLRVGEASALQRELVKVAGASAQAQVRQAGNGLALDLHWQGGGLAVQGQVGP
ncbi:prepilin-type N-terminal cleavage/methylation domain-containing protein [Pseudomonas sp. 8209]|uniref:type IV pilus modification PilV family protein n=1 Tax=Pseudomonas sp. 8209 TaxID=2967214 RepID=UPI00236495D7|nr:prepilin-type N-terminal cleavage/methylation domain-containing protein [Pseudomonas sp. 8209]MDD1956143.1 prepilin-type N-terminal cleavage/methylation domain-containing protein [Pseudomonas sp. 8209]